MPPPPLTTPRGAVILGEFSWIAANPDTCLVVWLGGYNDVFARAPEVNELYEASANGHKYDSLRELR